MNIDWIKGILYNNSSFLRLTSLLILTKKNFTKISNPIFPNTNKVHIHLFQTNLLISISPLVQTPSLASLENLKDNHNHFLNGFRNKELEILD